MENSTEICGIPLTDRQAQIATMPGSAFVVSCPGAGKTRTIVARALKRVGEMPGRQGIAVLSFTNVATNEIQERCRGGAVHRVCMFPNFVGTFDSFVNRFLVVLFGSPWSTVRPEILDSWSRLLIEVRPRQGRAPKGLSLDELVPQPDGEAILDLDRVNRVIRSQVQANQKRWEIQAQRVRKRLLSKGYLTCDEARVLALRRIRDNAAGPAIAAALKSRFAEIIVDEAQDCNDQEIELLEWFHTQGIPLVVVCDPDQGIYEFRGARPTRLNVLAEKLGCHCLGDNFRSTANICGVSATLRCDSRRDTACGEHNTENLPVILLEYDQLTPEVGRLFAKEAVEAGVAPEKIMTLAHSRSWACRAADRSVVDDGVGTSKAARLAEAVLTFRHEASDSRARLAAIEGMERLLLGFFGIDGTEHLPRLAAQQHGVDERWLRRTAFSVLMGLPDPPSELQGVRDWLGRLGTLLEQVQAPAGTAYHLVKRSLPPAPRKAWKLHRGRGAARAAMTVHQAKGMEFEAVLFVVPPDSLSRTSDLVAAWESKSEHEPKRVAYVAVTRAKRLLGIAVPSSFAPRIRSLLDARGVACKIVGVKAMPVARQTPSTRQRRH